MERDGIGGAGKIWQLNFPGDRGQGLFDRVCGPVLCGKLADGGVSAPGYCGSGWRFAVDKNDFAGVLRSRAEFGPGGGAAIRMRTRFESAARESKLRLTSALPYCKFLANFLTVSQAMDLPRPCNMPVPLDEGRASPAGDAWSAVPLRGKLIHVALYCGWCKVSPDRALSSGHRRQF